MEGTDTAFKVNIQKPLTYIWKELRIARDLAVATQIVANNRVKTSRDSMTLVDKIDGISNALWAVRDQSFRLHRRFNKWAVREQSLRLQRRFNDVNGRVSNKLISKDRKEVRAPLKSEGYLGSLHYKKGAPLNDKMQQLGKYRLKGTREISKDLKQWHEDLKKARAILKSEGYLGSLNIKKGTPLYEKIEQLRQHRLLGTRDSDRGTSASGLSQQSGGFDVQVVAQNQGSINDAPAALRLSAKRGDQKISYEGTQKKLKSLAHAICSNFDTAQCAISLDVNNTLHY